MKVIFTVSNWEEHFVIEEKVAHAKAIYKMTGDLVGTVEVDYSIYYFEYNHEEIHASTSRFEGFGVFVGEMNGKIGTFSYYDSGSFINNQYETSIDILEGTGTGDFVGISGKGTYEPNEKGMLLNLILD